MLTGKILVIKKQTKKPKSNFDWNNQKLNIATVITDNYKNTENVRNFFVTQIGTHFSFNLKFMNWMKENTGKTLNEAILKWKHFKKLKKDKILITQIAPQFEYNRYMRAFLLDNPNLSSKIAMKFWKLKKTLRGVNNYEKADLNFK